MISWNPYHEFLPSATTNLTLTANLGWLCSRDAQEKTSARPPCNRVELKSSHRCKEEAACARSFRTSVLLVKGVDHSRQTGVRLRSRHHNHSRSLAHPPLPPHPHPPRPPLYSRPLWQCSRSSRLLCSPCQPRDCAAATQTLASVPKAHTSALRVFQPGGGRPFEPRRKARPWGHTKPGKGRERARCTTTDAWLHLLQRGSRCQANDIREHFKFSDCP